MPLFQSRKHAVHRYAAAFAALSLPALATHAETPVATTPDPTQVSQVVIKGQRTNFKTDKSASNKATADILDTPQTVQVIGKEIIAEQGATTLTEALRNSPGVGTFYLGENGSTSTGDAVYLRGSDASGSLFVDGIRDVASVSRDVFDIEQVEVLKGAAGTDIGRGSATGAIDLWSKHPALQNFYNVSVSGGDADFGRATADLNWKFTKSSALRLNLMDQDAGVAGRDDVKTKRSGFAASLGFGLGTDTRLYVDELHIEQNNTPDGGVVTFGLPGYSSPDPAHRAYLSSASRVDPGNFYGTKDDFDHVHIDMLTFMFQHDINDDLHLTDTARWSRTAEQYQLSAFLTGTTQLVTPSATDPSTWTATRNINNKDAINGLLTNQLNLQAQFNTGFVQHATSMGLELIREDQTTYTLAATGAYPAFSIYNPNPDISGYTRKRNGAYAYGQTDTVGLYISDTAKLSDAWLLNAGVRLDSYDTRYETVPVPGTASVTLLTSGANLLTGKMGLVYKPAENGSFYASYAVTKLPPGGTTFTLSATTTANANNPDVAPQAATTSEAGTKWDLLHDHLSISGAVYSTAYSDSIALDTDGTYYRTGDKTVSGIELGAVGELNRQWSISSGYTIIHTQVKNQPPVTADGSPNLSYTPSDSFTLWATYTPNKVFTIGGGLLYNSEMKRGSDSAVGTPAFTKSYVVYNGIAQYRLNKHLQLQFNVYNLFDKTYVAAINKSGYRYTPGQPRNFRLTLNVAY